MNEKTIHLTWKYGRKGFFLEGFLFRSLWGKQCSCTSVHHHSVHLLCEFHERGRVLLAPRSFADHLENKRQQGQGLHDPEATMSVGLSASQLQIIVLGSKANARILRITQVRTGNFDFLPKSTGKAKASTKINHDFSTLGATSAAIQHDALTVRTHLHLMP